MPSCAVDAHLHAAKVGRSKGPAFKNGKGVSLHWDQEVSTTHGKFTLVDGQLAFTDLGSTNGSFLLGASDVATPLGKNEACALEVGSRLRLGSTVLRVAAMEDL